MNSFACPLNANAVENKQHPALIFDDVTITYQELNIAVTTAANHFKQNGIQENTRVGLWLSNPLDMFISMYALWRLKAIACPFNLRNPESVLYEQIKTLDLLHVLTDTPINVGEGVEQIEAKNVYQFKLQEVFAFEEGIGVESFSINQPAVILFTSGSTDRPKAALLSLGNLYFNALGANEHLPLEVNDRWLCALPLYHVGGLGIFWRMLLGNATVVLKTPDEEFQSCIKKYHITHLSLVATQLIRIIEHGLQNNESLGLKAVLLGGESVPKQVLEKAIQAHWPIHCTYGLTEMASQVATSQNLTSVQEVNAKPLNYREVKISSDHEILVRGETLFQGYCQGEEVVQPLTEDGWFQTGDLGQITSDGYLNVTGRKDNLFVSGGENIQPEEIEHVLMQLTGVKQAVVIPFEHKEFGYRPACFIQFYENQKISSEDIKSYLLECLPKFKCPDHFLPWPTESSEGRLKCSRLDLKQRLLGLLPQ